MTTNSTTAGSLRRFLTFLRPHWKLGLLGGAMLAASVALQLPMPLLTMYLVDHVIPQRSFAILHWIGAGLGLFLILQSASAYGQNLVYAGFRNRVMFAVRRRLFFHLEHLPLSFFEQRKAGYLTSRVSSDVNQLQGMMANNVLAAFKEGLTLLVGIGLAFWIDWKLAVIAVAILPAYVFWLSRWNPRVRQLRRQTQEGHARVTGDLLETVCGIHLVKAYLAERRELVRMLGSLRGALNTEFAAARAVTLMTVGAAFFSSLGKLSLIWFGCWQIMTGDLTLGGFLAFNSFLHYLFGPAETLVSVNAGVQESLAAADRIFEILDTTPEQRSAARRRRLPRRVRGEVVFDGVTFSYDGRRPALSAIDLRIAPGTTVALVGASGAGKSTLVKLLAGLYPVESGTIRLDGIDLREIDLRSLREQIAWVPQETYLFSGDVWTNLRYGKSKASKMEMVRAARLANADEFLARLPDGYDTQIGERGVRLSGGQRQRLAIAMAFLKDAPILVLDEATSAIDSISEAAVQEALARLTADRTTFIIAHRLTTVQEADLIVVLDRGRIVEQGTHHTLLHVGGRYSDLYSRNLAA